MNALYKFIPEVNPLDLLGFEQVFLQIGYFAFVLQNIIDTAGGDIALVETEIGKCADVLSHAHNKHTLAVLGNTDVVWAEDDRFGADIVTYLHQCIVYDIPRVAMVVRSEVSDIFKECIFGLVVLHNTCNIKEKRAFGFVRKAKPFAGFGERLARKACTKDIVCRDVFGINAGNIAFGLKSIVAGIGLAAIGINVRCKDTFPAEISHGLVETAYAAKEVYEFEMSHFCFYLMHKVSIIYANVQMVFSILVSYLCPVV